MGEGAGGEPRGEPAPDPTPGRGTHPQSASRCSPWLRGPPGPGPHRLGARAGGSTGSRAAAPAALQRRGCLRSAPLPPPLSIPPHGSLRRRRRRRRHRLAPPPRSAFGGRGGGCLGIGCAQRLPALPPTGRRAPSAPGPPQPPPLRSSPIPAVCSLEMLMESG